MSYREKHDPFAQVLLVVETMRPALGHEIPEQACEIRMPAKVLRLVRAISAGFGF